MHLPEQVCSWDTQAHCWDVKQSTTTNNNMTSLPDLLIFASGWDYTTENKGKGRGGLGENCSLNFPDPSCHLQPLDWTWSSASPPLQMKRDCCNSGVPLKPCRSYTFSTPALSQVECHEERSPQWCSCKMFILRMGNTGLTPLLSLIFFFCVPSYISRVHHFGWDVCDCFLIQS